ncbi:Levanase [Frankliniella fusca]|uniref:Levanase n=1 Tax=Frankliniella fusca TaxID=407009 RepID=A0AAE1LNN4_9NEOP|nr:Levanase [Frankliniella fusca]
MASWTHILLLLLAAVALLAGAPAAAAAPDARPLHEDFKGQALAAVPPPEAKAAAAALAEQEAEACPSEPYRPLVHFTPRSLWINDPNGLVYANGEWHLFYQFNPLGNVPGNISWGHAVSPDLVRWRELTSEGNAAITFDGDRELIFSGSAVVDQDNTSGLGTTENPPMVAIYTSHNASIEAQSLAFSLDAGRTWSKYAGNPVLNEHEKEFRDPKVQWHGPTRRWLMAVSMPNERKIRFYSSPDLKAWTLLSDFGPMGAVGGQYECPDLFPLPVDGDLQRIKWVLVVNVNPGGLQGGSSGQYFIGDFDGERFVPDNKDPSAVRWLDYGKDYYAAVSWVGAPDGKRYMIGWMSNWLYAEKTPTSPWRNAMSVPRLMSLRSRAGAPEGVDLVQEPVAALRATLAAAAPASPTPAAPANVSAGVQPELLAEGCGGALLLEATVVLGEAATGASLLLRAARDRSSGTAVTWDARKGVLAVDRRMSGRVDFSPEFPGVHEAPLAADSLGGGSSSGALRLQILLDEGSVEVFADGGRVAITDIIFPKEADDAILVKAEGTAGARVAVENLTITPLRPYRESCPAKESTCRLVHSNLSGSLIWIYAVTNKTQTMMLLRAVLLAALAVAALGYSDHLVGHSVLRVTPRTERQLLAVREYLDKNPALDVWLEPSKQGRPVDVSVSPAQRQALEDFLQSLGLEHEVFIEDLHSLIRKQALSTQRVLTEDTTFDWTKYHNLKEIYDWFEDLKEKYPDVVSVIDVGKSEEGRLMKGLVIKFDENLPVAMVESGIHAREWIAPASATFFIDQILKSAATDVVRKYEWHIFPSVNPDGYEYTWTTNRMWRKTRSTNWLIFKGVDANRNWPFHWMEAGASLSPFSETYAGPSAASEVETRNLQAHVDQYAPRMHIYISLHSYSQLLMFPWGWTPDLIKEHADLNAIAQKSVAAIKAKHGTQFTFGDISSTIYPAAGSTLDYAYSKCVPYPFVYELRDLGKFGFALPDDQIIPAAEETWEGVKVIVDEVFKKGLPTTNPSTCPNLRAVGLGMQCCCRRRPLGLLLLLLLGALAGAAAAPPPAATSRHGVDAARPRQQPEEGGGVAVTFHGHKVVRVLPASEQQVRELRAFLQQHPELDAWTEPTRPEVPVDVRVSPNDSAVVREFLGSRGLVSKDMIVDVGRLIENEQRHMLDAKRDNVEFGWDNYHDLEEIYKWMQGLEKKHPGAVQVVEGGRTSEGRRILGVRVKLSEGELPVALLEAGIHAREWISPATATFLVNELLTRAEDDDIAKAMRAYEWHIFPVANPDGYVYTHTSNRLWRKSRSKYNYFCLGADLNRNWPFHWREVGASPLPCSETYAGPRPESEPETQGLRRYLDALVDKPNNKLLVYISIHSYSQLLMFPWGYTIDLTEDHEELNAIARASAQAAARRYGTQFRFGPIAKTIYAAAGSTLDYAYSKGVKYPFVFELRDDGTYGFLLPKEQIKPAAEETVDAINVIVSEALKKRGNSTI